MAADAVNFRFNKLRAELTFRHQENFVLHKHQNSQQITKLVQYCAMKNPDVAGSLVM